MSAPHIGAGQLTEVLGALHELVVLADPDRSVRFVNRTEEGYELDEILGTDVLDFVAPEFRKQQAAMWERVLESREPESYEIPVLDAEGERQWYKGRIVPLVREGDVTAVVMVTRNVTERHRAQEEAEKLRSLVPVCSWCGDIRDDEGYWQNLETYIEETEGSRVTHGICPNCDQDIDREAEKKGA